MRRISIGAAFAVLCAVVCPSSEAVERNIDQREINGQSVRSERDEQQALFDYYYRKQELQYQTKLGELKEEASVPKWRIPYSTAIHPETGGGLSSTPSSPGLFGRRRGGGGSTALTTYDSAFNGNQSLANSYEVRRTMGADRALFPRWRMQGNNESWEGYCSGFTASTIKHPEPVNPVDAGTVGGRAGVVLQPSEIKALLTGIYNRTSDDSFLFLAPPSAKDGGPNMGTFHLTLANYIGLAETPVGFDRTKGRVSWNNPIYSYKVNSIVDAGTQNGLALKDVTTNITYTYYGSDGARQTDRDTGDRVGNQKQSMTLRYVLALNEEGEIVGGRARSSSGHFLWIPLYAVQAKADGSAPGNPYLDIRKVLDLARASALPEVQSKYDIANIGPAYDPAIDEVESDEELAQTQAP